MGLAESDAEEEEEDAEEDAEEDVEESELSCVLPCPARVLLATILPIPQRTGVPDPLPSLTAALTSVLFSQIHVSQSCASCR